MVVTRRLHLESKGHTEITDLTRQVAREVTNSGLRNGTVTIFVPGSTAGLTTVEYEPGLVVDLQAMFERLAPGGMPYQHDQRWGDGNGYAHVRASLLGPSLVVPFVAGALTLGTWQQIVFVDFDNRPRSREILLQILGE